MLWLLALAFGIGCAFIAHAKGRNWVGWFFVGFLLGLIGLIISICMSNLNEERQYRSRQADENRRLREKLRQEQLKLESLRRHTAERLDMHDKALNIDTRTTAPVMLGAGYAYPGHGPDAAADDPSLTEDLDADGWYFVERGRECGPVTLAQLAGLIQTGTVQRDTLVWQESMTSWTAAGTVAALAGHFS